MRFIERGYWTAATLAIVCAEVLGLRAQAPSSSVNRVIRPQTIRFADFCEPAPAETPPVSIISRRFQWARALPSTRSAAELIRTALDAADVSVAVSVRWLVVHDAEGIHRADCETGRVERLAQPRPVTALALSQFGDVAEQVEAGPTLIFPRPNEGEPSSTLPIVLEAGAETPPAIAWSGRRLIRVTRARMTIVDLPSSVNNAQSRGTAPVDLDLETDPVSAVVFNGLTYLAIGRCVDVFVGAAMTPRIRQAACFGGSLSPDIAMVVTRDSLAVMGGDGTALDDVPRPSVMHAKLAGTTFEITSNLLELLEHPAVARVPLGRDRPMDRDLRAASDWGDLVPRQYWNTRDGYERMLGAVDSKGWTNLHGEGPWSSGNGVAVGWRRTSSFVAPRGRSLKVLAQLTDQKEFNDTQLRQVITGNSELAESLEGSLIELGWVPVGALFGDDTTIPLSFVPADGLARQIKSGLRPGASAVYEAVKSTATCQANRAIDPALSGQLRKGLPFVGFMEGQSQGTWTLRAQNLAVRTCGSPTGQLEIAELTGGQAIDPASKSRIIDVPRTAVAGVRGLPNEVRASLVRSWLDRVLRTRPNLQPLLLPTTALELEFVVDARTAAGGFRVPGVQLTSAEAAPASTRADPDDACRVVETALKARLRDEQAIHLHAIDFSTRTLSPPLKIGVAENAVPLLHPLFIRDGQSIWVEPKALGGFGPVQPPLATDPSIRPTRFLKHGSQVAGILFTSVNAPVRGVLSDAPLVWIDAMDSPSIGTPTLEKLAARKAIVNVSDRLDASWSSLSQLNQSWTAGLLFVAAAKNVGETIDGPPLTWTPRGNVIGVGTVDSDGNLPSGATYDRDVVDLVAPGTDVPTIDDTSTLGCADGNSFATAYVSAVAAMLADRLSPGWTVSQLKARLLATADWRPAYTGKIKAGLINGERAFANLDRNVLVVERGATNPPLELRVTWKDAPEFEISGEERPNERTRHRIQWSDVLRWLTVDEPDNTKSIRVTFIGAGSRYVVLNKVIIAGNLILPLNKCMAPGNSTPVPCAGTRAELIREYVAALPQPPVVDFR
jgi:hypothetical protein